MTHTAGCRLPKKPSALILLALDDLGKAEKSAAYKVDMQVWHESTTTEEYYDTATCKYTPAKVKPCVVCLAGSVMAFSLHAPPTQTFEPNDYDWSRGGVASALQALDDFRDGDVASGLHRLYCATAKIEAARLAFGDAVLENYPGNGDWSIEGAKYKRNRDKFKRQMRAMAKTLASVGL